MQKPTALLLTLGLAATFASTLLAPTFAQFATPQSRAHGGRLQKLAEELNLTDAQKAQLKPILTNARQQAKAIKADTTLTPDAQKAKLRELNKTTQTQMRAVLTPAQIAQLKAIRQARREAKANG